MSFSGMDTEVVASVARALDAKATVLETLTSAANNTMTQAANAWHGQDGASFYAQWRERHHRALLSAVAMVREMAAELSREAQQQEQASDGGGPTVPAGSLGSPSLTAANGQAGSGAKDVMNRLQAAWSAAGGDVLGTALDGLDHIGEVADWADHGSIADLSEFIGKNPFVRGFGLVGTGISITGDVASITRDDPYGAFYAIGDSLKATPGSPLSPLHLGGYAIDAWTMAGQAAAHTDWSAGAAHEAWDYVVDHPTAPVEEFGKAAIEVFGKVFG